MTVGKRPELCIGNEQGFNATGILIHHPQHLERLPAGRLKSAHEPGHVLLPVQGRDDSVKFQSNPEIMYQIREFDAVRNVITFSAAESLLHCLVRRVDGQAHPVDERRGTVKNRSQASSVGDDARCQAELLGMLYRFCQMRIERRFAADKRDFPRAGMSNLLDDSQRVR